MKVIGALVLAVVGAVTLNAGSETCFFQKQRVSGSNRICTYKCLSGEADITIKSTQVCPLRIDR